MVSFENSLVYFKNIKILLNNRCNLKLFLWCVGIKYILCFNFLFIFLKCLQSQIYITTFKINYRYLTLLKAILIKKLLGSQKQFMQRIFLHGMGYKVIILNNLLLLSIGYSHLIKYIVPAGLKIKIKKKMKQTLITLECSDFKKIYDLCNFFKLQKRKYSYTGKGFFFSNLQFIS
jgi:hypothetical protein